MKITNNLKGFTLIELLVVISIIGILSSFAVVSLNSARAKARDSLRKGDMSHMRSALNIYFDDHNSYPVCGTLDTNAADWGATVNAGSTCYNTVLKTALTGGAKPYLGQMPKDPKNVTNVPSAGGGDDTYLYRYVSEGNQYDIAYHVEEVTAVQIFKGL